MEDVEHPQSQLGSFAVQTETYSGPLELLIDLIEKRKLLINDISLSTVTDDYMKHVALLEQNPLRETAQFVVLASTLLLIKSRSLLPVLDLTDKEEESVEELQNKLKRYQIYRNASRILGELFGKHISFERSDVPKTEPLFVTDRYTTTDSLHAALCDVVQKLPKKVVKPKVQVRKTISLEEMMDRLKDRIERQLTLKFKDFTGNSTEKSTVIVGFLAVLEMVKQGSVVVRQTTVFNEIEIEREGNNTPRYI